RTVPSRTMSWRGPGLVAFGGPASSTSRPEDLPGPRKGVPCHLESFRDVMELMGLTGIDSPPEPTPSLRSIQKFFEKGGGSCLFLDEPWLGDPSSAWIGEDGGPGRRTGVYALSEIDEVGSIVLPAFRSARRRELLLSLASRRPDLFFFLE